MTTTTIEKLSNHPLTEGLDDTHLTTIAAVATDVEWPPGARILTEGDDADACYLLLHGDVSLEILVPGRGPHVVQTLHGGETLGWSWLFPPYRWAFDARAITRTTAIRLDAADLRDAMAKDSELAARLMERIAHVLVRRLKATRYQVLDVYGAAE